MDKYTATEQAYKNGYEKGYEAGKKVAEDEILILKQKRANMFEILDAYERGRANALKWIPVSERLPEEDGKYLVCKNLFGDPYMSTTSFAKDGRKVCKYDFRDRWKKVWYEYDSEYGYVTVDTVTHWMPLPEPPKEGE